MRTHMIDFFGLYTEKLSLVDLEFLSQNTNGFDEKISYGSVKYEGYVGNMKFNVNEYGLQVYGSPASYTYGNNFKTLKHADLNLFMDKLSDALHFDVRQMSVSKMDITDNLEMNFKPVLYKRYMGNCRYLQRVGDYQYNGIKYQNGSREILVYDKKIEALDKGVIIPTQYKDKNLLRFEYRMLENINQYLNGTVITRVDDLIDRDTFIQIIDCWEQMFHRIELVNVDEIRHLPYNPALNYDTHLVACGVISSGGLGVVLDDLKDQFHLGRITDRQLRYKKKKFIKAVETYHEANNLPSTMKDELLSKLALKAEENRMLL